MHIVKPAFQRLRVQPRLIWTQGGRLQVKNKRGRGHHVRRGNAAGADKMQGGKAYEALRPVAQGGGNMDRMTYAQVMDKRNFFVCLKTEKP